jgi:hypothetical protein
MTLFCIAIKMHKHFRLRSKPPEQSMATLQYPCHRQSQKFIADKPFFHVSSWSATVGAGRHSGNDAENLTTQLSVHFNLSVSPLIYIAVTLHRQALTTIPKTQTHFYSTNIHQDCTRPTLHF